MATQRRLQLPHLGTPGVCGRCGETHDVRKRLFLTGRRKSQDGRGWTECLYLPLCAACDARDYEPATPSAIRRWKRLLGPFCID